MTSVFICYRREESGAEASLLREAVNREFGEGAAAMDRALRAGAVWADELKAGIEGADTVLAVIGPDWLRAGSDEWGQRRIDQEEDWVRQELTLALNMRKQIVPVLVRGGNLPPRDVLPPDLQDLVGRQAIELRRDYWDHDVQLLLAQIGPDGPSDKGRHNQSSPYPRCFPEGPDPMAEERLERILASDLSGWKKVVSELPEEPGKYRVELYREYEFKSFGDAIGFMSQVAPGCDIAMHHPRWENIWQTIRVYLTTWDIGHRLSDRDVQLARYFDRAFAEFPGASAE